MKKLEAAGKFLTSSTRGGRINLGKHGANGAKNKLKDQKMSKKIVGKKKDSSKHLLATVLEELGMGQSRPFAEYSLNASGIDVLASTRDEHNRNRGLILEITDADGRKAKTNILLGDLVSKEKAVFRHLIDLGARVGLEKEAQSALKSQLTNCTPKSSIVGTTKTGWVFGRYVTPGKTFGGPVRTDGSVRDEELVYLGGGGGLGQLTTMGSLGDWQKSVASLCVGNPHLVFAISAAFASTLIAPMGEEGGGFHLLGPSSTGKSTALYAAQSVWGPQDGVDSWDATLSGLGNLAARHSDSILCLDEFQRIGDGIAGDAVYLLANGAGRTRSKNDGSERNAKQWNLLFLSSGEVGLPNMVGGRDRGPRMGQVLRMPEIPVVPNGGKGIIYELHGRSSSRELVREFAAASEVCYGTPIVAFLDKITRMTPEVLKHNMVVKMDEFHGRVDTLGLCNSQTERVADRFALVGAAGNLATEIGITGWSKREARDAVLTLFRMWFDTQPTSTNGEMQLILKAVRTHFHKFGRSRYAGYDPTSKTIGQVDGKECGYRIDLEEGVEYWVNTTAFENHLCKAYPKRLVLEALEQAGILVRSPKGEVSFGTRDPGTREPQRFYKIVNPTRDADGEDVRPVSKAKRKTAA